MNLYGMNYSIGHTKMAFEFGIYGLPICPTKAKVEYSMKTSRVMIVSTRSF
jgi:hypothetical protein